MAEGFITRRGFALNIAGSTTEEIQLQTNVRKSDPVIIREARYLERLSDPDILPSGIGYGCSFSPCGSYLAVAHTGNPFITIYRPDGDSFIKLNNPDILPSGTGWSCSFSPCGSYLAVT